MHGEIQLMGVKISILTTEIHENLTNQMILYAEEYAKEIDLQINEIIKAPGSLEFPFFVNELLSSKKNGMDGLLVLGAIAQGQTKHGEIIGHQVTKSLIELQVRYRTPISIAIIGHCTTIEYAQEKAKKTTEKAMRAIVSMINFKRSLE